MIVEYIRYTIPPGERDAFVEAYEGAARALAASPHCLAYELSACDEDPTQFVLRIEWDSSKGHLEGFRRSEHFRQFLPHIQPYVKAIAEMRHYTPTRVRGTGGGHAAA